MAKLRCDVCLRELPPQALIDGHGIRHEIVGVIHDECSGWSDDSRICRDDYTRFREEYLRSLIADESGAVRRLEDAVLHSIAANDIVSRDVSAQSAEGLTRGERWADRIASFGGSWTFIGIFFVILVGWILINTVVLVARPFDPYPFILMNLVLSCLAAVQAPIIMMSQNRQEAKDRLRSENDFKVNLKAELEVRTLHEKVDHLLLDQWAKMVRIQELQIEMLTELRGAPPAAGRRPEPPPAPTR